MKKHNILVTVNGVSKSRAQWAKELGVTKGAISLRESKGESASSAIAEIIGTVHTRKILEHYAHAKEKHPHFEELAASFAEYYRMLDLDANFLDHSPATQTLERTRIARAVMDADLAAVRSCDAIYLLRGWESSRGAKRELAEALAHGLQVMQEGGEE